MIATEISEREKDCRTCSVQFELWSNIHQEIVKRHLARARINGRN